MSSFDTGSRRRFLKNSLLGGLGLAGGLRLAVDASALQGKVDPFKSPAPVIPEVPPARVALTTGDSRADNTFRALRPFEKRSRRPSAINSSS